MTTNHIPCFDPRTYGVAEPPGGWTSILWDVHGDPSDYVALPYIGILLRTGHDIHVTVITCLQMRKAAKAARKVFFCLKVHCNSQQLRCDAGLIQEACGD